MKKTIGIVGSRRRATTKDARMVEAAFLDVYQPGDHIVSGGCPQGADSFAEHLAKRYEVPIKIHYAAWKRLGKRAGFARNGDIAAEADVLIACVSADRTGGTEDTIRKWQRTHQDGDLILIKP